MKPRPKPPSCEGCPAFSWGVGFVPPVGPTSSPLLYLGQGPGEQEAYHSQPFVEVAPAGARFTSWVHKAGGQRTEALVSNVVWCWLPKAWQGSRPTGNREPTEEEAAFCTERHLLPWLSQLPRVRWIVTLGAPAAKWALGLPWSESPERYMGAVLERELPPVRGATP